MLLPLLQEHGPEEVGANVAVVSQDAPPPISSAIFGEEFAPTVATAALEEDLAPQQATPPASTFIPPTVTGEDFAQIVDEVGTVYAAISASDASRSPAVVIEESTSSIDEPATPSLLVALADLAPIVISVPEDAPSSIDETALLRVTTVACDTIVPPPPFDELTVSAIDEGMAPVPVFVADAPLVVFVVVEDTVSAIDEVTVPMFPAQVDVVALRPPAFDELTVSAIDEQAAPPMSPQPEVAFVVATSIDELIVSAIDEQAAPPTLIQDQPMLVMLATPNEDIGASGIDEWAPPLMVRADVDTWTPRQVVIEDEVGAAGIEEDVALLPIWPSPVPILTALAFDEERGITPTPPPPPPPTPSVGGTPMGMGGGGGWGRPQIGDDCYWDEDQHRWRPRGELYASEADCDTKPPPPALGDVALPGPKSILKPLLVDLLVPGAASYAATKAGGALGAKLGGAKGRAVGTVGTFVATLLTTKGEGRGATIAGSGVAAIDTLVDLYQKAKAQDGKRSDPLAIRILSEKAFTDRIVALRAPVQVSSTEEDVRGKSGRMYRVLVIRYFIVGEPGRLWTYQDVRIITDGAVDISGTLLERLSPR